MNGIQLKQGFTYYPQREDEVKLFNEKIYKFNGLFWFEKNSGINCKTSQIIYNAKTIKRKNKLVARRKRLYGKWECRVA